jgi:hypothetical protein
MTATRDEKTYDVRTLERRLRRGLISKKDYEKYLKGLPDTTAKAAAPDDDDDDDDDEE